MAYDKNVFVLGAGASKEAGAPLLNDFLRRARELLDNKRSGLMEEQRKAFQRVFQWRQRMAEVRRLLKIDIDNVEELFSLVDMSCQLGFDLIEAEEPEQIRHDLKLLISRTLELTIKMRDIQIKEGMVRADETYYNFVKLLQYWKQTNTHKDELDSVITLNYDTALEHAFNAGGSSFMYSIPWSVTKDRQGYRILKLHGSLNWGVCQNEECNYKKDIIDLAYYTTPVGFDYALKESATTIYRQKCPECKNGLVPFIVPPTWNKAAYSDDLRLVWKSAREELESAERIIFIGYSLPQTDSFFKYLLALGLSRNPPLQEIVLIDPAAREGEPLTERYREFIGEFFDNRNFTPWPITFMEAMKKLRVTPSPASQDATLKDYISEIGLH